MSQCRHQGWCAATFCVTLYRLACGCLCLPQLLQLRRQCRELKDDLDAAIAAKEELTSKQTQRVRLPCAWFAKDPCGLVMCRVLRVCCVVLCTLVCSGH